MRANRVASMKYSKAVRLCANSIDWSHLNNCKIAIIGCTGSVGSAVTAILIDAKSRLECLANTEIVGVARKPTKLWLNSNFKFVAHDLSSSRDLTQVIPICDYYIYIAGTASDYINNIETVISTQFNGLISALKHSRNSKSFVYISSTRIYGRRYTNKCIQEHTKATVIPLSSDNIYDCSKHFGESLCYHYFSRYRLPVKIARITNVYGAIETSYSKTAISDMTVQAKNAKVIKLTGSPHSVRNYCSDIDVATGIFKTLINGKSGEAYNIGSSEHLTNHQLAKIIAHQFKPIHVRISTNKRVRRSNYQIISTQKARDELGFTSILTIRDVIPLIIQNLLRE